MYAVELHAIASAIGAGRLTLAIRASSACLSLTTDATRRLGV